MDILDICTLCDFRYVFYLSFMELHMEKASIWVLSQAYLLDILVRLHLCCS